MRKPDYSDIDAAEGLGFAFKAICIPVAAVLIVYFVLTGIFG